MLTEEMREAETDVVLVSRKSEKNENRIIAVVAAIVVVKQQLKVTSVRAVISGLSPKKHKIKYICLLMKTLSHVQQI